MEIYQDKTQSIQDRIEDLLGKMTLKEKVAQLYCFYSMDKCKNFEEAEETLKDGIGTVSYLNNSMTGNLAEDMEKLKKIQTFLVEKTRLGIPGLIHSEGIAGAQIPGATVFPQSLAMASSWDPESAKKAGQVVRKQCRAYGFQAVHSPLFDVARDPRWGRIGETYGEDPYLISQMGVAYVKGLQEEKDCMATAKHFVGYAKPEGGRNGGDVQISERRLYDTYCLPFEAAIHEAGVMAVMNSYGMLNEQVMATSKWLLTDILRGKLGFNGLTVSDYGSISHALLRYRVAKDKKEAAILSLTAGLDVEQPQGSCYPFLVEAVESGELDVSYIDRSVRRVLETKFKLGLFENPYALGDFYQETENAENEKTALEIAEKTIVMVKNDSKTLPLAPKMKIALIGPLADDKVCLFGGYSSVGSASTSGSDFDKSQEDTFVKMAYDALISENKDFVRSLGFEFDDIPSPEQRVLIMEVIKQGIAAEASNDYSSIDEFLERFYPNCASVKGVFEKRYGKENILYAKGCDIMRPLGSGMEEVRNAVSEADLVIAVLGGKESMTAPDATCGENKDNANVGLERVQLEMMREVFALGKPVVSVIIDGRPLAIPEINEHSQAVLYAFLPGQSGAAAIYNILAGTVNPSGKLPVTVVKDAGQIPMYHGRLPFYVDMTEWSAYIDSDKNQPLYPFGHGLSYTNFAYSDLSYDAEVPSDGSITIAFSVTNTGDRKGDEVAQIYIRDCICSIARPTKQLTGFARISLEAGETKRISVEIDLRQLAFHDLEMKQVVEPGDMEIYVGASSQDIRLQGSFTITGDTVVVERKAFSSNVTVGTV